MELAAKQSRRRSVEEFEASSQKIYFRTMWKYPRIPKITAESRWTGPTRTLIRLAPARTQEIVAQSSRGHIYDIWVSGTENLNLCRLFGDSHGEPEIMAKIANLQIWTENEPKMNRKWSDNVPEMIRKWSQKGALLGTPKVQKPL